MVLNDTANEEDLYHHANVYSRDLKWVPMGKQLETHGKDGIKPLLGDIMIAKLRPGQEIEMELYCEKGVGKTHAKWSPVCPAYYRLVPDISFKEDIKGDEVSSLAY
jgi:DNA-directed RNA polymerase I and III subunit RPAC1